MKTAVKRIRKDYAPLITTVGIECATSGSPVTQVFDAELNEYEPSRTLTPTVLVPVVIANANDGSWIRHHANRYMSTDTLTWLVNGKDIKTVWSESDYSIDYTEGDGRGSLIVKKDIPQGGQCALRFKGAIADYRTGVSIPVESGDIILSTYVKASDSYEISLGNSETIMYNPMRDKLDAYEYKVAHGIIPASSETENEARDINCYIAEIPIEVYKAKTLLTEGYNLKLYRIVDGNDVEASVGEEIVSISNSKIVLDLRLICRQGYKIKAFVDGRDVATVQFSVGRLLHKFDVVMLNGCDIHPSATMRTDEASILIDGKVAEYPERCISIVWFTNTYHKQDMQHNEGRITSFELNKTGIGVKYNDSWLETYVEADYKSNHKVAVDENGNTLTDENGNTLIFN